MDYRILGPLEVSVDDREIEIGGPKQRALLAVLLLHANEVVSPDVLIDELWGETPPPTAAKALHVHVSRLRKALANGALRTSGSGYVLRVEPGRLDADRFAALLGEAQAERDPKRAADLLRRALGLWRGPALADLAYESFAQEEIARLEELRLTALEERIEADLALGRHAALVGELEALIARHPLRERFRAQLMLALYRSDRQAEALNAYQDARLALAEAVGLDPSENLKWLERRILHQDPSLALPAGPAALRTGRVPRLAVVAVAAAAVLAAAAALLVLRDDGEAGGAAALAGGHAVALDARTGELLATVPLGTAPQMVAAGAGGVWVMDAGDRTVSQIDPAKRALVRTFGTASTPTDVAAGRGSVWIGNGFAEVETALPESVARLDLEAAAPGDPVPLPGARRSAAVMASEASLRPHVAVTPDAVWAVNPDLSVSRIDPRTNAVVARVPGLRALSIAAGDGEVWVVDDRGEVVAIDTRENAPGRRIEIAGDLATLAVGAGAVWVTDPVGGSVWRVEPEPKLRLRTIPLAIGVSGIAFGAGAVWATNEVTGEIYRIDPRTYRSRVVYRTPSPRGVAVSGGTVWAAAAPPPPDGGELPASACRPLVYGGPGEPQLLIASDLPLQGPGRAVTQPMVEAIEFVLKQRGFKAGDFTVGYQACDDATAQAGTYDPSKCLANAGAYARDLDVIGVIGPYNSGCAYVQIPVANQAAAGPLAMIGTSSTATGLTRPYAGMRRGDLEALYPTGTRNYVRIAAADHLQSVAAAELVRELGRRSLFLLAPDGDRYFTADVRTAAENLGLRIAGEAAWDTDARTFDGLARRIARSGAEAVFIHGFVNPSGGALIRDLWVRLGADVALIAPDWFVPVSDLLAGAGAAAQGMYITVYGLPNSELPPPGRELLESFDRTAPSTAVYAAQAAEILLAAIARSDGSRASVARELLGARVEDGLLGDIDFDQNGDPLAAPVTVFRVTGRRGSAADPVEFRGAVVDRTIVARADRLR
jgi:DNA-binding SARP family transcriptional activator/ABC-type branched-subunit amino acid transport system substrate-binding protein